MAAHPPIPSHPCIFKFISNTQVSIHLLLNSLSLSQQSSKPSHFVHHPPSKHSNFQPQKQVFIIKENKVWSIHHHSRRGMNYSWHFYFIYELTFMFLFTFGTCKIKICFLWVLKVDYHQRHVKCSNDDDNSWPLPLKP